LHCFIENHPIRARPLSNTDHLWKWCRRNPTVASLAALTLFLLVTLSGGLWVANAIRTQRDEAIRQRELATSAHNESNRLLQRAQLAEKESRVREHLAKAVAWQQSGKEGQRFQSLEELRQAMLMAPPESLQDELISTALSALALTDIKSDFEFSPSANPPSRFDHQGKTFVQVQVHETPVPANPRVTDASQSAYSDFSLLVRQQDNWNKVRRIPGPDFPCWFAHLEFTDDDQFLIVCYCRFGGSVRLVCFDSSDFEVVHSADIRGSEVHSLVAIQKAKSIIAYQSTNGELLLYDLKLRQVTRRLDPGYQCWDLCFDSTGDQLAIIPDGGNSVRFIDANLGTEEYVLNADQGRILSNHQLAWSDDNRLIAATLSDGSVEIWNTEIKALTSILRGHIGLIICSSQYLI
jgi:WD40 repeat protein